MKVCTPTAGDFRNKSLDLTFSPGDGGQQLCRNITLIDDSIYEDNETYILSLMPQEAAVIVVSPTALLIIIDEVDSKGCSIYYQ